MLTEWCGGGGCVGRSLCTYKPRSTRDEPRSTERTTPRPDIPDWKPKFGIWLFSKPPIIITILLSFISGTTRCSFQLLAPCHRLRSLVSDNFRCWYRSPRERQTQRTSSTRLEWSPGVMFVFYRYPLNVNIPGPARPELNERSFACLFWHWWRALQMTCFEEFFALFGCLICFLFFKYSDQRDR